MWQPRDSHGRFSWWGGENVRFEEELAKDVLEIITVFSARLYGSRSNKNKKLLEDVQKAVEDNVKP